MLMIVRQMRDFQFEKLMAVYAESNLENGKEKYPHEPDSQQILRAESDFYQYLVDFFHEPGGMYCILSDSSGYISALRLEPYQDGLLLEALETRPDRRHQGYAKELIGLTLQYLQANGAPNVYSHVSKRNKASLKTHLSCGFERTRETAIYIDGSVSANCCTLSYQF